MSWRFNADIKLIEFDKRAYQAAMKKEMTEHVRESARVWLRTVLAIVPTWSRASRATFEALAQAVGFNVVYGPQLSREDRLILGLQTGRGGVETTNTSWHFFYETDLRYLAYNEFNHVIYGIAPNVFRRAGLINPTPYHFQDAGKAAFETYANTVRLPNPIDYIKPKKI